MCFDDIRRINTRKEPESWKLHISRQGSSCQIHYGHGQDLTTEVYRAHPHATAQSFQAYKKSTPHAIGSLIRWLLITLSDQEHSCRFRFLQIFPIEWKPCGSSDWNSVWSCWVWYESKYSQKDFRFKGKTFSKPFNHACVEHTWSTMHISFYCIGFESCRSFLARASNSSLTQKEDCPKRSYGRPEYGWHKISLSSPLQKNAQWS